MVMERLPSVALTSTRSPLRTSGRRATRSEERRVGKECRSLCDWSSDVCSSDLGAALKGDRLHGDGEVALGGADLDQVALADERAAGNEIGRASCRERV